MNIIGRLIERLTRRWQDGPGWYYLEPYERLHVGDIIGAPSSPFRYTIGSIHCQAQPGDLAREWIWLRPRRRK